MQNAYGIESAPTSATSARVFSAVYDDVPNLGRAAGGRDAMLGHILAAGACPMVWSSIPSQDPLRPGFTGTSVYGNPGLGAVVSSRFAEARAHAARAEADASRSRRPPSL